MRIKWAIVLAAVCVVVTVAAVAYAAGKATGGVPDVIRAQRFEVVDSQGRVRVALSVADEDTGSASTLVLFDGEGKRGAVLRVMANGGLFALSDDKGQPCAALIACPAGPRLEMYDEAGRIRTVVLAAPTVGNAKLRNRGLVVLDENGDPVWGAP